MNGSDTMTMDFFTGQEKARKNTVLLVFLFVIAVILIILSVYVAISFAVFLLKQKNVGGLGQYQFQLFNPKMFGIIAGGTVLLVGAGSLYKISQLGKGGMKVAEMLRGRPVYMNTDDPQERKLLNVVEEVAIASGVPVPLVYLLPGEESINAFAAGYSPSSAVVAVTKGAITHLSRDELQGVIAHEFSHILNGDMRLNIRLIGVLHGILLIGITGRVLLDITVRSRGGSRRRGKGGGKAGMVMLGLGLALFIIGYIGVFFGKLIKAAVSRQREFLADSASVQFTRNPGGIAGALKKIGGLFAGSRIRAPKAEEASHIFFSNALSGTFLSNLLSTHPPLDERIKAIDPLWDGKYTVIKKEKPKITKTTKKMKTAFPGIPGIPIPGQSQATTPAAGTQISLDPRDIVRQIGVLTPALITHAAAMLSALPDELRKGVRDATGAKALIYASLMNRESKPRDIQWKYLSGKTDQDTMKRLEKLLPLVERQGPEARLTLVELAMPVLRGLQEQEGKDFLQNVDELTKADEEVSVFEFALGKVLRKNLAPAITGRSDKAPAKYYSIKPLSSDVSLLLSTVANIGNETEEGKEKAFAAGVGKMGVPTQKMTFIPEKKCGFDKLDQALDKLRQAAPGIKRRIMRGLAFCVAMDKTVTVEEKELIRAIADPLDCPLPPLVAQKKQG